MDKVIIVESPSKSKTISSYLGKGYTVLSSKGHICDLATSGKDGLGIDIENNFNPTYKILKEKEELVSHLQKVCHGKTVYLATDPDREGEAIAYHLANALNLDLNEANRIEFHEITKKAVNEALLKPHAIDLQMVDSQECRRMIDRILGFKLSKLLQRKIGSKSAGRVQSVALMMICDLEREISNFVPTKYYEMEADFNLFKLKLSAINGNIIDNKNRITDRTILENLKARLLSFTVFDIQTKQIKHNSMPTYTTSTLQQDASNKLGYTATRTMRIAQSLYEGKALGNETAGLITYMRTDSTRLSDEFVKEASTYILNNYGNRYIGYVKTRDQKGMQDAHEGIRPTDINRTPESISKYLSDEEFKLYSLIYKRTLASLMASAVFNVTKVEFSNTDSVWTAQGQQIAFDGYLRVYGKSDDDENSILPDFKLGMTYSPSKINILDKETAPKNRYTEASLIKDMEEKGIGRPSTYASTIQTLKDREYIKTSKKSLVPTEQGIMTTEKLHSYFNELINIDYTAQMETNLDKIAQGEKDKTLELSEFVDVLTPLLENAKENMGAIYPIETEEICPKCRKNLVIRLGKYGEFISCSNFPDCTYTRADDNKPKVVETECVCPKCKKGHLVERIAQTGKNKGNIFYACSNYPKCKATYSDMPIDELCPDCGAIMLKNKDGVIYCSEHCNDLKQSFICLCPDCGKGNIVERIASKGKNKGKKFYACSNYPKCKAIFNDKPLNIKCPNCGAMMLENVNGERYCQAFCTNKLAEIEQKKTEENENVICPICQKGHLIKRVATKGKNAGNVFYGCSNFPKCKNIVSEDEYKLLIK